MVDEIVGTQQTMGPLDMVPRSWYIQQEIRHGTLTWETISQDFIHSFSFLTDSLVMTVIIGRINDIMFHPKKP